MQHFKAIRSFLSRAKEEKFNSFTEGFIRYLCENQLRLSLDPLEIQSLSQQLDDYRKIRQQNVNRGIQSHQLYLRATAFRQTFTDNLVNYFNDRLLNNPAINYIELAGMGFPVRPVEKAAPTAFDLEEIPEMEIVVHRGGRIVIKCLRRDRKRALPVGARMLEIRYEFASQAPSNLSDYRHSQFFTGSYVELNIDPNRDQPFLYITARWLGNKTAGAFCQPIPAVVMG